MRTSIPLFLALSGAWACSTNAEVFGDSAASTGSATASSSGQGPGSGGTASGPGGAGPTGPGPGGGPSSTTVTTGPGGQGGIGQGGAAQGGSTGSAGAGPQGGAGGALPDVGCSDGTREAFVDAVAQPNIAGCAGGFEIPGVTTPLSMQPQCGRVSGNSSVNPSGAGCSVEDLCSEGWHLCQGVADVSMSSSTGKCEPLAQATPLFWITRAVQDQNGDCAQPPLTNNIVGCGSLGQPPAATCAPLDRRMRVQECIPTAAWFCGNGDPDAFLEAAIVYKISSEEGGALCCHN